MYLGTVVIFLAVIVALYFYNNPMGHSRWFMVRRFINWFPLGMTYAFLCMGRYNLIVAKSALGTLMSKEDLGIIFGVGTCVYALSFLVNGPLIDKKLGGKQGMIISALGASLANIALGVLTWLIVAKNLKSESRRQLLGPLCAEHVFSELRLHVHHQGQGLLVPRARTRRLRRHFRDADFDRRLFRVRLGQRHHRTDQRRGHPARSTVFLRRPARLWMRPGRCFTSRRSSCSSGCCSTGGSSRTHRRKRISRTSTRMMPRPGRCTSS